MPNNKHLNAEAAQRLLMGDDATVGVFERALGFRTNTEGIKAVHVMNDLAQSLLGGAPKHGGDFIARVIRFDQEDEPNTEQKLREDPHFGAAFNRAYPAQLGPARIASLRKAARSVLNFDGGVYEPGKQMASALATHRDLLGFEGFRRFRLGPYLARVLTEQGKQKLKSLYESDADPVTRTFLPLLLEEPLINKQPSARRAPPPESPFDASLGAALSTLLSQPLSKPALLRKFALGASLGLILRILGAGRENGRPVLLATATGADGARPLREPAVMSFRAGVAAFDLRLARMMAEHEAADELTKVPRGSKSVLEVRGGRSPVETAQEAIAELRRGEGGVEMYWPEAFAVALGRKAGCILPNKPMAGWGTRLALPAEFVELLILMFVRSDAPPTPWRELWGSIRDSFGVVIGANAAADAELLRSVGVEGVSLEKLTDNANTALDAGVRLGVARRLPDSGAEAGGSL